MLTTSLHVCLCGLSGSIHACAVCIDVYGWCAELESMDEMTGRYLLVAAFGTLGVGGLICIGGECRGCGKIGHRHWCCR